MAKIVKEKTNYRDDLVQQIKDAGQELIDRAEDMVSKNTEFISDFSINIYFPQGDYVPVPEITWTTEVVTKNTVDRLRSKSRE